MSDPFMAEIRLFPLAFAPVGWAFCDGQSVPIVQNDPLFQLLGTTYGGDGITHFKIPDLKGRVAMHAGEGLGLTPRTLGETGGELTVLLGQQHLPAHTHALRATATPGDTGDPEDSILARPIGATPYRSSPSPPLVQMHLNTLNVSGGSFPHNNLQPYLALNFCIALQGTVPTQSG